MEIRDIKELDEIMTDEKKAEAHRDFRRFYPEGTPEIMCTSKDDGENHLRQVNLEDFK